MRWLQKLERSKADFARGHSDSDVSPRPFVTASFAISRDGCLTRTRGHATRISGPESLRVTHELRARHDALLVGVGTVLSDDPALTTRLVAGPSPLRVVLDSSLRVPVTARLLHSTSRAAWLVTTSPASGAKARALAAAGADLVEVPGSTEGVSLPALLGRLAVDGVRSLMLEGGAEVLESFVAAGFVDYLVVTIARRRLGNPRAVRVGPRTRDVLSAFRAVSEHERLGDDWLATGPLPVAREPRWARTVAR